MAYEQTSGPTHWLARIKTWALDLAQNVQQNWLRVMAVGAAIIAGFWLILANWLPVRFTILAFHVDIPGTVLYGILFGGGVVLGWSLRSGKRP